jgi:hypothetical protein
MTNETWWINHVDRALYNSQEFVDYYHGLASIEKRQHLIQAEAQRGGSVSENGQQLTNSVKKPSGLRSSIKSKLLGASKSGTQLNYASSNSGDALVSTGNEYANDRNGSEFMYQRELNRHIEKQQQLNQNNLIDMDDQFITYNGNNINYYDEMHRPKRLNGQHHHNNYQYKASNSSSSGGGGGSGNNSSNTTTTHSTPSKGNYVSNAVDVNTLQKVLGINVNDGNTPSSVSSASGTNNSSDYNLMDLGNNFSRQMNLNGNSNSSKIADLNEDLLLNYPSDNEYVYDSTKQKVMDQFKNYNGQRSTNHYYGFSHQPAYIAHHQNQRNFQPVYHTSSPTTPPSSIQYQNNSSGGSSGGGNKTNRYGNPRIETNI